MLYTTADEMIMCTENSGCDRQIIITVYEGSGWRYTVYNRSKKTEAYNVYVYVVCVWCAVCGVCCVCGVCVFGGSRN